MAPSIEFVHALRFKRVSLYPGGNPGSGLARDGKRRQPGDEDEADETEFNGTEIESEKWGRFPN